MTVDAVIVGSGPGGATAADVLAKYVDKMMKGEPAQSSISVEELVQQGF